MNRETAKRHLECIKAFSEGKNIQCYYGDNGWLDCDNPFWLDECKYRIKPEPEVICIITCGDGSRFRQYADNGLMSSLEKAETEVKYLNREYPHRAPYTIKKFVQDLSYESPA